MGASMTIELDRNVQFFWHKDAAFPLTLSGQIWVGLIFSLSLRHELFSLGIGEATARPRALPKKNSTLFTLRRWSSMDCTECLDRTIVMYSHVQSSNRASTRE